MSTRTAHSHAALNPYRDFDFAFEDDFEDDNGISQELMLGERICPPQPHRKNTMLPAFLAIIVLSGIGWALMQTRSAWEPIVTTQVAALASSLQAHSVQEPQAAPTLAQEPVPAPPPIAPQAREIADAPGADAGTPAPAAAPVEPVVTNEQEATSPPEQTAQGEANEVPSEEVVAPLPPPVADPTDPFQQRALAAGLHPDLSRGLLRRMSDIDFRNAGIAIKKALAQTPDGQVFSWPQAKQGASKVAQFEVHFVKGISPDCRRYVVTVTKDRWSTTARPMEKCGLKSPQQQRG